MDWSMIEIKVIEIALPVLLLALTLASLKISKYIKSKIKSEYLKEELLKLNEIILTVVKEQEQVFVRNMQKLKDGEKLSSSDRRRVKQSAIENIKSYIGKGKISEVAKMLNISSSIMDKYLSSKVESTVLDLKRDIF